MLKGPNQLDERVPVEVGAIQVNFCKNPQCQNFAWLYNKASLHAIDRFFIAGPKEIVFAGATDQQFGQPGSPLVWLRPL